MATFEEFYKAITEAIGADEKATKEQKSKALDGLEKSMPFIKALGDEQDSLGLSPEENYILRYLAESNKEKFLNDKNTAYDLTVMQIASMMYVHNHKATVIALTDAENRLQFVKSLTAEQLKRIKLDPEAEEVKQLITSEEPELDDLLDLVGFGNLVNLYEKNSKKFYRTKAKAQDAGALSTIPSSLAIPTLPNYQYSMSLYQAGGAYLQPLTSTDGLKFKGGKMYFEGIQLKLVSEVELQNMKTKEGIDKIDLALLRVFYSIILTAFEESKCTELKNVITLYVPDLAEYLGQPRNLSKLGLESVLNKVQSFHNIVGVLHGTRNGKPSDSLYPVLNFEGYNDKKNTISFSSPYMNHVIKTVYDLSIRTNKKDGKPRLKKNGEPLRLVTHSYLIDSSISSERNKAAVENVAIIVTLIEQAGDNIPRIKASTIIERNPQFKQRLEESKNQTQLIQRVFSKTWELLQTKTKLQEVYEGIELPDPKDPRSIPTAKNLDKFVFEFKHKGKKSK